VTQVNPDEPILQRHGTIGSRSLNNSEQSWLASQTPTAWGFSTLARSRGDGIRSHSIPSAQRSSPCNRFLDWPAWSSRADWRSASVAA
jgi:hypothetical protein